MSCFEAPFDTARIHSLKVIIVVEAGSGRCVTRQGLRVVCRHDEQRGKGIGSDLAEASRWDIMKDFVVLPWRGGDRLMANSNEPRFG